MDEQISSVQVRIYSKPIRNSTAGSHTTSRTRRLNDEPISIPAVKDGLTRVCDRYGSLLPRLYSEARLPLYKL